MDHIDISKLYGKFGVVRDVYLPRKRSDSGKKFNFVRYDCSVAAGVAIQRTNVVWMHDKELKVKFANFHKKQGASNVTASLGVVRGKNDHPSKGHSTDTRQTRHKITQTVRRPGLRKVWVPLRMGKHSRMTDSYVDVVRKGISSQEEIPMIKVDTIGNGWLYRSAVASFADHCSTDYLLASFMDVAEGNFTLSWSATLEGKFGWPVTVCLCMHGTLARFARLAITGVKLCTLMKIQPIMRELI
ncbi:hypothetical protein Dimus_031964 [Dionaea muscipula]